MISAYWNQLPVRTRGLIASTALAVLLAMLTLVQQQFTVGTIDWHAILSTRPQNSGKEVRRPPGGRGHRRRGRWP